MINASPLYDQSTDEGRAKLAHDTLQFARTVQNKKLTGSQITDELQKELHPQEEKQKNQTVKTMLDNIWPIAKGLFTGTPPTDLKVPASTPSTGEYSTLVSLGPNFQWNNRPEVDTNSIKQGTTGTVLSASREENGVEVLFPRIYDGKLHSEDEAWQHYKDTGQYMAKFSGDEKQRIADADAFGQKYHEDAQAGKYGRFGGGTPQRPKGVPANAVWNGGAKQWQLPQ